MKVINTLEQATMRIYQQEGKNPQIYAPKDIQKLDWSDTTPHFIGLQRYYIS